MNAIAGRRISQASIRRKTSRVRRPTRPSAGYQHAMTACLEGRGYSVK